MSICANIYISTWAISSITISLVKTIQLYCTTVIFSSFFFLMSIPCRYASERKITDSPSHPQRLHTKCSSEHRGTVYLGAEVM